MKSFLVCASAALSAFAFAPAANAAVTVNTYTPADPTHFAVSFDPDGTISANIGHSGITGAFKDTFSFLLVQDGIGSGGVIATFAGLANKITLTFVSINGVSIDIETNKIGFTSASAANIPLFAGQNELVITGTAGKNASYGGNITFVPNAVPEPATWAMMLVGFGMMGAAMRYRRRQTNVVYA